jgi:uncharacterized membrane protein
VFAGVFAVDCYYHNSVPSVAVCHDCGQAICTTCRDGEGICPGCRLERRMQNAGAARSGIPGGVGPSNPPPPPGPPPGRPSAPHYATAKVIVRPESALATVSPETRGLLALGYPLWPLAAIALINPKRSEAVRRQSIQALALNGGVFVLYAVLAVLAPLWIIGWSAALMSAFLIPVWIVATVVYGFKTWQGEEVRVPIISDWLDEQDSKREARANA